MSSPTSRTSYPLIRAPNPVQAFGQIGGHVKMGFKAPKGRRTGKAMALVSALPLAPGSDQLVLAFIDRSDPEETFDNEPHHGDNLVVVVPKTGVLCSVINGVNSGDWKGVRVALGDPVEEPDDLDVDPTGLDLAASDRWVDMVDELGVDGSKLGGWPLWTNAPVDLDRLMGKPQVFHHRLTGDLIDFKLGDGGVIYVFVDAEGTGGSLCWQQAT
ncbi:MAG: hypothetical protein H0X45_10640 [Planctomycetes bacterium]|nr:hypothetical protein [Planctomycetota bacterium]